MALRLLRQYLVLILWLWTSPAVQLMNMLGGADGLVLAPAHAIMPDRILTPTHSVKSLSARQVAEDQGQAGRTPSVVSLHFPNALDSHLPS